MLRNEEKSVIPLKTDGRFFLYIAKRASGHEGNRMIPVTDTQQRKDFDRHKGEEFV